MSRALANYFLISRHWVGAPQGGGRSLTGVWGSRPHGSEAEAVCKPLALPRPPLAAGGAARSAANLLLEHFGTEHLNRLPGPGRIS